MDHKLISYIMDTITTNVQYQQKAKEVLHEAKELYRELCDAIKVKVFPKDKWTHVLEKEGINMYKYPRPNVSPIPCYLVEATYGKTKDALVKKIWDSTEETAKKYDLKISMWRVVEKGDNYKVCSQYTDMPWPLYPRHIVYTQYKIDEGNTTYLVSFSVDHPDVIIDEKTHVKSKVHLSVYAYIDNGDNTTTVWRILQVDPCGNVPTSVVDYFSASVMNMFITWKNE